MQAPPETAAGDAVGARHAPPGHPAFSVVVPCYDEQGSLPSFHARLGAVMAAIDAPWEVVYVDDGSRDATHAEIEALRARDPHVTSVRLSRNFGKEIALTAGLDLARGHEAVIVIDADLQDPPEIIAELVDVFCRGDCDSVYARRRSRRSDTMAKRVTAHLFYRVMARLGDRVAIPPDTGDFRLVSRRALDVLLTLRERHRFMKGLFAWVGFPVAEVLYDREERTAGRSRFNYWALWNFAIEGITSFTVWPLKIATYVGLAVSIASVLYGGKIVMGTWLFGNPVPGYPSLMSVILFLGGIQLMTLGLIGEYLGRIFNETKNRPLYVVRDHLPASDPCASGARSATP